MRMRLLSHHAEKPSPMCCSRSLTGNRISMRSSMIWLNSPRRVSQLSFSTLAAYRIARSMRPPLKMRISSSVTLSAVNRSSASNSMVSMPPSSSMAAQPGTTAPTAAAALCRRSAARPGTSTEERGAPMHSTAAAAATAQLIPPPNSRKATQLSTAAASRIQATFRARRSLARSLRLCSTKSSLAVCTGRLSSTHGSFCSRSRARARMRSLSRVR